MKNKLIFAFALILIASAFSASGVRAVSSLSTSGIYLEHSSDNTFYNNLFNSTVNTYVNGPNSWNITSRGNYWAYPNGTGFSERCTDRGDGICDEQYNITNDGFNIDYLPLTTWVIVPPFSGSGDGTPESPYNITNCTQLQEMENNLSAYYVLGNDINCSETSEWNGGSGFDPIGNSTAYFTGTFGNSTAYFTGTFDGQNHTITGLYINVTESVNAVGLFSRVLGGAISNVGLEEVNVMNPGGSSTAGLVGATGTILMDENGYLYAVSGATITNCYVIGNVTGRSGTALLVDLSAGSTITNCYSAGSVTGIIAQPAPTGGLVGRTVLTNISHSYSTASVSGFWFVGGLLGVDLGGTVMTDSYATGNVTGSRYVGGLAGGMNLGGALGEPTIIGSGAIANCHATGNVARNQLTESLFSVESKFIGGLIGAIAGDTSDIDNNAITNSYATGDVSGSKYVGGLVGINGFTPDDGASFLPGAKITNSFSTGSVNGSQYVGGLAGINNGTITNSYYNNLAENPQDCIGLEMGSTQCTTIQNNENYFFSSSNPPMNGWDFVNVWKMPSFAGYPLLRWQSEFCGIDCDGDGINNTNDNCPKVYNPVVVEINPTVSSMAINPLAVIYYESSDSVFISDSPLRYNRVEYNTSLPPLFSITSHAFFFTDSGTYCNMDANFSTIPGDSCYINPSKPVYVYALNYAIPGMLVGPYTIYSQMTRSEVISLADAILEGQLGLPPPYSNYYSIDFSSQAFTVGQPDGDGDGVGDVCDNRPSVYNPAGLSNPTQIIARAGLVDMTDAYNSTNWEINIPQGYAFDLSGSNGNAGIWYVYVINWQGYGFNDYMLGNAPFYNHGLGFDLDMSLQGADVELSRTPCNEATEDTFMSSVASGSALYWSPVGGIPAPTHVCARLADNHSKMWGLEISCYDSSRIVLTKYDYDALNKQQLDSYVGGIGDACQSTTTTTKKSSGGGGCLTEWKCADWSSCANGKQTRNCAKANPLCYAPGTMPALNQTCSMPAPKAPVVEKKVEVPAAHRVYNNVVSSARTLFSAANVMFKIIWDFIFRMF